MTATSTEQRRQHYDTFVTDIAALCHQAGIRADLSSGLGRPVVECSRLHRHLTPRQAGHAGKRAHYTVASLIALNWSETRHSRPTTGSNNPPAATQRSWYARPNLGTTLAHSLTRGLISNSRTHSCLETFVRLDAEQLHPRLPGLITYLGPGALTDWAVLLADLAWWDYDRNAIGYRWQEAFYLTLDRQAEDDVQ